VHGVLRYIGRVPYCCCSVQLTSLSLFVFLHCTQRVDIRMEFAGFTVLAAELRVVVLAQCIAAASLKELMVMYYVCTEWQVEIGKMLAEWLGQHEAGSRIGEFSGTKEEIQFVVEHIDGLSR
jgi:hypothetical protein